MPARICDIGKHFPNTDPKYKGADSLALMREVGKMLDENHYLIENIDATIIAQAPKMRPYIDQISIRSRQPAKQRARNLLH